MLRKHDICECCVCTSAATRVEYERVREEFARATAQIALKDERFTAIMVCLYN